MSTEDGEAGCLSEKFEEALNIHLDIQESSEPFSSESFQGNVHKAISLLEAATHMVNDLDLFSTNEEFEEIATSDLKYLLLPALLGHLTSKLSSSDRLHLIETSEEYFKDYLTRLKNYGVVDITLPEREEETGERVEVAPPGGLESLEAAAHKRRAKIERYNMQKELEKKQKILKSRMDTGSVDDETVREYYSVLLKSWVNSALEELESIKLEKPILRHMAQLKAEGREPKRDAPKPKPIKPVIIARNELQKRVIGVGYPSIPILTVDEFYDRRYGCHGQEATTHPGLSMQSMAEDSEKDAREIEAEEAEKEEKEDKEDPVHLIRERNWDEWKDEHRRGWGNRHNMG